MGSGVGVSVGASVGVFVGGVVAVSVGFGVGELNWVGVAVGNRAAA